MRLHTREIAVYQYFHPKLRELRNKAGFKDDEVPLNVPEIYFTKLDEEGTSGENTTVLVMQELKALGFTMRNKEEGCSFDEARQVLGSLANYHALTMALIAEYRSAEDEKKLTTLPEQLQVVTAVPVIHQNYDKMVAASLPTFVAMMKTLNHEEVCYKYFLVKTIQYLIIYVTAIDCRLVRRALQKERRKGSEKSNDRR